MVYMNSTTITNGTTKTCIDQTAENTWEVWQSVDEASGEWILIATFRDGECYVTRAKFAVHVPHTTY